MSKLPKLPQGQKVYVYYGSASGRSEEAAFDLWRELKSLKYPTVQFSGPQALDAVSLEEIFNGEDKTVIFIVSTTGQGDCPENMSVFWKKLKGGIVGRGGGRSTNRLPDCAVFGLGDSKYKYYNVVSRRLYGMLKRLGCSMVHRLGCGDDQHDFGYEQEFDPWLADLLGVEPDVQSRKRQPLEKTLYEVRPWTEGQLLGRTSTDRQHKLATVLWRRCLTPCREPKEAIHLLRLFLPAGHWVYKPGDVCKVWPEVDFDIVTKFVEDTLGRQLTDTVVIEPRSQSKELAQRLPCGQPLTLGDIFSKYLDITAIPGRYFFSIMAEYADEALREYEAGMALQEEIELLRDKLVEFGSRTPDGKNKRFEYCEAEQMSYADVLWDFRRISVPLDRLLELIPPIAPRSYSLASCPDLHAFWRAMPFGPGPRLGGLEFDLCVGRVTRTTPLLRVKKGLASTYLTKLQKGESVRIELARGQTLENSGVDDPRTPLFLMAVGTGVAPIRALVQKRLLQVWHAQRSDRLGRIDVVLGHRHPHQDFLFGQEWQTIVDSFPDLFRVVAAWSRPDDQNVVDLVKSDDANNSYCYSDLKSDPLPEHLVGRKTWIQDVLKAWAFDWPVVLSQGSRTKMVLGGKSHPMPMQVWQTLSELSPGGEVDLDRARKQGRYFTDTWA
ncbi:NADPH fad oxidoreductase, putative [Perkinsus marinus ATCC 50983]|uniref:NADPH fad oxidoreductase, putative n=1 Tax=Perkinsus marinus (strain ATCC 50983 / TXsc) TaxID=423536 RepID=C5L7P5_PERM5|nr:NADPH fad oxidoreductase, putative [Perkinsus marinus ATCC 50983]EER07507.1 NADPH fad oxidoreductase, putative [Perkinsus marinus ATCC 50983]|eukprot:XP_002775691.1 NADPH fad oxidoreductase, putative [Perkinsus marinus ATCC 50983]